MFEEFDFTVLDSPDFKEDAVREEIIAPIIRRLGYRPSGPMQVQRSKTLVHPFVMIGSRRNKVNVIPDYTLYADGSALAVIEAKGPKESLIKSPHVEQAFSYAIHPDVRVKHYGLCNGRELVVYTTDKFEPILRVSVQDIEKQWSKVGEALHPRFLKNPELRGFAPDLGLAVVKAGFSRNTIQIFVLHHLQLLARITDDLYTVSTTTMYGDIEYIISLDISVEIYRELLNSLPQKVAMHIADALGKAPFCVDLFGKIIATCSGYLGDVTKGEYEDFIPIKVAEISDVDYNPTVKLTPYSKK